MEALQWVCKGASAPALALIGFALLQPSLTSSGVVAFVPTIHVCSAC